jgi:hypothetical protein
MVKDVMLDPARLRECMDYFRDDRQAAEATLQKELKAVDARLAALQEQTRRIIDIYASVDLSRDGYIEKNRKLDAMIETLRAKGKELADKSALLREDEAIATGIEQFSEGARVRFKKCKDFANTRQFLLDYVEKVTHVKDKVSLHGRVPIKRTTGNDTEINELAFCIEAEITREDRYRERMRVAEALDYQQSLAALRPITSPASTFQEYRAAQVTTKTIPIASIRYPLRLAIRIASGVAVCSLLSGTSIITFA